MTEAGPGPVDAARTAVVAGLVVTVALVTALAVLLGAGSIEAEDLLVAGQQGPSVAVITEDFGPPANERTGYDGQQTYVVARALPDLDAIVGDVDDPAYRATRILQPLVASPAPDGPWLVLALAAWSAVGIGLAVAAVTDLAVRHGRPAAVGYLALLPLLLPLAISTTEALGYGLALAAVALLDRRRLVAATVVGVLAVLTRETAVVVLGLAVLGSLPRQRWRALPVAVVPVVVLAVWMQVVRELVPGAEPERFAPFALFDLDAANLAGVLAIVALGLVGAWCWRDVAVLWPVSLGFAVSAFTYRTDVLDLLALPRVVAPSLVLGLTGLAGRLFRSPRSPDRPVRHGVPVPAGGTP